MYMKPTIVAMDLEGVLVPEVWIAVAEKTGIEKLRLTTRDISDYDELMKMRIAVLKENGLKLLDIQEVIDTMDPLPGANDFLDWLREEAEPVSVEERKAILERLASGEISSENAVELLKGK